MEVIMPMMVVISVAVMFMFVMCVVVSSVYMVVRFVRMAVIVSVIMASMGMTMAMMSMAECCHANDVDYKPKSADSQQFFESVRLAAFCEPLNSFIDNLNADEPRKCETAYL